MTNKTLKHELRNILSGKSKIGESALIQATANYLRAGAQASFMVSPGEQNKSEETKKLIEFINEHKLWVHEINPADYISEGAEQKVYIHNERSVLKLNDGIYYASWIDYLHNLLLNNFFFPDTAYKLQGFYLDNQILYAVVEQPFVKSNEPTDLTLVKEFLTNNGFENTRNHDYYNPEIGVILEDLHDENVLTQNGILYFIDTVFYLKPSFFE